MAIEKQTVSSGKVQALDVFPLRFPPFPTIPNGISIIPFKDFVPYGYKRIKMDTGEEIEVDALGGLPTVKVLSDEEVAQKIKDYKKRRNAGQSTDATGRIVPWWEEWEEAENSRITREPMELCLCPFSLLNAKYSFLFIRQKGFLDRVHDAADDFRVGRTWPPISSGVRTIWDHVHHLYCCLNI
jgi:hypothetical protein